MTPCYRHQIYHTDPECPKCYRQKWQKVIADAYLSNGSGGDQQATRATSKPLGISASFSNRGNGSRPPQQKEREYARLKFPLHG